VSLRSERECPQNEQIERALREIETCVCQGMHPLASTQDLYTACCISPRGREIPGPVVGCCRLYLLTCAAERQDRHAN
jgi:hypothetical protein